MLFVNFNWWNLHFFFCLVSFYLHETRKKNKQLSMSSVFLKVQLPTNLKAFRFAFDGELVFDHLHSLIENMAPITASSNPGCMNPLVSLCSSFSHAGYWILVFSELDVPQVQVSDKDPYKTHMHMTCFMDKMRDILRATQDREGTDSFGRLLRLVEANN